MNPPILETERLILRGYKRSDFDSYHAQMRDPLVMHHLGGPIESRAIAWEKFLRGPGFWSLLGFGLWCMECKADGAHVGQIGFGDFQRDMDPPLPDLPEMAWLLGSAYFGQGYASEALDAVLKWGDYALAQTFQCIISPENTASLKLAARHGFCEVRLTPYKGEPIVVLER
jgi:RimJ/RimL family protein N-acetyltransferase